MLKTVTSSIAVVILVTGFSLTAEAAPVMTKKHFHQVDKNQNGVISRHEYRQARKAHRRVDLNDDGRIGKRERKHARHVKNTSDLNNDNRLTGKERKLAKKRMQHADSQL